VLLRGAAALPGAGATAPEAGSGSAAGSGPEPARVRESWEMGETAYALPLPGSAPVIAKAHHGSVSKEQRLAIERELKSGRLRCVVATASLELGIDMGAIDLVLQIAPPPSVASGMQRVGRADHRVGGRPHGIIYPVERTQLIDAAVTAEGMRAGDIERTVLVTNALDVLAQQTVAAAVVEDLDPDAWYATVRRAAPYAGLPRPAFDSVLEMLTGAYACADLSDFAPRLVRDPGTGALTARPGAQRREGAARRRRRGRPHRTFRGRPRRRRAAAAAADALLLPDEHGCGREALRDGSGLGRRRLPGTRRRAQPGAVGDRHAARQRHRCRLHRARGPHRDDSRLLVSAELLAGLASDRGAQASAGEAEGSCVCSGSGTPRNTHSRMNT